MKTKSLWIIGLVFLGICFAALICFSLSMGTADQLWCLIIFCFGFAAIIVQGIISWRRRKWVRGKNKGDNDDDDNFWPRDARYGYWRRR